VEEFQVTTETVKLGPGDIMVLYTDGVTEVVNAQEEEFGRERLAGLVQQRSALSARDLIQVVRQALQEFTNGQPLADDTTIIVYKIKE
jgi:sigma-B regulation protein RsbU (phosphoserine phosphatase)